MDFHLHDMATVRAVSAPWSRAVELLVTQGDDVGINVVMAPREEGVVIDPTMTISTEAAQGLMDDLWQCGFRPTEGSGSAGAMRAAEKHIEDLRKVAFKVLEIG